MKIINPLSVKKELMDIQDVLITLASQNNCDGYPYDQMMVAAEYITTIEQRAKALEEENAYFLKRAEDAEYALVSPGQFTYCAYCGRTYPADDVNASAVSEHIRTCEKHPMRKAEARIMVLEEENLQLLTHSVQCLADIREAIGDNGKLMQDELVERVKELKEVHTKYNELLMAVERKHPEETRHETALRYIKEVEEASHRMSALSKKPDPLVAMKVMGSTAETLLNAVENKKFGPLMLDDEGGEK